MLDFLIAGVQRAGTSTMHSYLSQHPQLFLPRRKELHFFDDNRIDWDDPDYDILHSYFADRQADQLAGEATPIYIFWEPCAERIHRYNPEMKFIVLLRDPVARAHSHWATEVHRGADPMSFSWAIREGRARQRRGQHRRYSYVERGFYAEQIARLQSLFRPEQMLFLRSEDLWHRHGEALEQTCRFLGVSSFPQLPAATRVNLAESEEAAAPDAEDVAYLSELYRDDLRRTMELTRLDLSAWSPLQAAV